VVVARFHLVLSTWRRQGVIGSYEGRKIAAEWRLRQAELGIAIVKVSFVPDHIHLAAKFHPAVSPADTVAALMNLAQESIQDVLVKAGLDRLWEPSVYVGSYGDLASPQIRKYIDNLRLD
jgi:REP element-mobilizing transposase RayT